MKENKEQTPITAHEFYNSNTNLTGYELMEQYAKVKVLEALEKYKHTKEDVMNAANTFAQLTDFEEIQEWYKRTHETEVKPKYE